MTKLLYSIINLKGNIREKLSMIIYENMSYERDVAQLAHHLKFHYYPDSPLQNMMPKINNRNFLLPNNGSPVCLGSSTVNCSNTVYIRRLKKINVI